MLGGSFPALMETGLKTAPLLLAGTAKSAKLKLTFFSMPP
jgi:hypothetical protein